MALADYPRPPHDNGRGIHWIPTGGQDPAVVDRFVAACQHMHLHWVTFLADPGEPSPAGDQLVTKLRAAGIEPVMRYYTPPGHPLDPAATAATTAHYVALGCHYFQPYNEPNLNAEVAPGDHPDPERFAAAWIPAAEAIARGGGLPAVTPMAPGGDYDDMRFLDGFFDALARRGKLDLLDHAWMSLHNYTFNHPLDYHEDGNGFRKYEDLDALVRRHLGRSLPVIGTEGGTLVGAHDDERFPAVDATSQSAMTVEAYRRMADAPPYFFAYSPWILANAAGGGQDRAFEGAAWFKADGSHLPVADAVAAMPEAPRA